MNNAKNGIEITITAQLFIEQLDSYNFTGQEKVHLQKFRKLAEKKITEEYARVYEIDRQMMTNALRKRENLIKAISVMDEARLILLSDEVQKSLLMEDLSGQESMFEKLDSFSTIYNLIEVTYHYGRREKVIESSTNRENLGKVESYTDGSFYDSRKKTHLIIREFKNK